MGGVSLISNLGRTTTNDDTGKEHLFTLIMYMLAWAVDEKTPWVLGGVMGATGLEGWRRA